MEQNPTKNVSEGGFIEEACKIAYLNFGSETAKLYRDNLKDKAEKEIVSSLEESLRELVGPENAKIQLASLKEKSNEKPAP